MSEACAVVGLAMRTGLGLDVDETCFGYRAGHAAMRDSAIVDRGGTTVTMCTLPTIDPLAAGFIRQLALAEPCVDDLLRELGPPDQQARVVVHLAIGDGRPLRDPADINRVLVPLAERFRRALGEKTTVSHAADSWALGQSLDAALDDLRAGLVDLVIIGGVHSDHDPRIIEALQAERRLFTPDRLDGVLPGEAVAFVALARASGRTRTKLRPLGTVRAIATAREKATPFNDEPAHVAAGLTHAATSAFGSCGKGFQVGWTLSDATFEVREVAEWQSVMARLQKYFRLPSLGDFPAHRLGHLGCAALPVQLALVCHAWDRGYAPDSRAALFVGADDGGRCVLIAAAPTTT